ncbi:MULTISPECIES: Crp/Fnr family transcriptional regulator [unclassified Lacinutrix]
MQSNQLIQYLETFGALTADDKLRLAENVSVKTYKAGEVFLHAGKIANQVGFITEGIFRYFFYDGQGSEITSYFMSENQFVTNITSFNEYSFSSGSIAAETDCVVLMMDRQTWELFTTEIPSWNAIIAKITSKVLLEKTNFQRQLINQDAKSSYLSLLNTNPSIINRVPQSHIASFLGITKFSLSRIRKQIVNE